MSDNIRLRPLGADDQAFVFHVFADARARQLEAAGLEPQQTRQLMEMQFRAQQAQYWEQYPDADFDLILVEDTRVGYVYIDRRADHLVLLDIALLREQTGRGIGGYLVGALIRESDAEGKPVLAHVEKRNRAWRLWQRLGFHAISDDGVYLEIEYRPSVNPLPR